jgi:hypothetical protein
MNPEEDELLRRFNASVDRGDDPVNAAGTTTKITTIDSRWARLRCKTCGHTFRLDDEVTATYDTRGKLREVRHLNPLLGCTTPAVLPGTLAAEDAAVQRFWAVFSGVERRAEEEDARDGRPPAVKPPLTRLVPGDQLLDHKHQRDRCAECANTFRPFETVVVCPCGKDCQSAIHEDISTGLVCYDRVLDQHHKVICLVTNRPRED